MSIIACQECKRQWDVSRYTAGQKLRCLCGFVMEVTESIGYAPEVQHCEACGAARETALGPCRYCGATVTADASRLTLVCPFCFHRIARASKFCSTCGKAIQAAPLDAKTGKLHCPRCGEQKLVNRQIGAFTSDECPRCAGMWVETGAFGRLVEEQASRESANVPRAPGDPPERSAVTERVRYIKCPRCNRMMNRFNFAKVSGVVIDECREHGVWLDCDELGKIADYVASGGLGYTRSIEREPEAKSGPHEVPFPAMREFPELGSKPGQFSLLDAVLKVVGRLF